MNLECQILIAVALDLIIGDPRWFPHPVKLMGKLAMDLEPRFRAIIESPRVRRSCHCFDGNSYYGDLRGRSRGFIQVHPSGGRRFDVDFFNLFRHSGA